MESRTGAVQLAAVNALGKVKVKSATQPLLNQLHQHLGIATFAQDVIRALERSEATRRWISWS